MEAEELNSLYDLSDELLGRCGKMLSGSKQASPERRVVWNGNVFAGKTKIWYGDISLSESAEGLQKLADAAGEKVYVLREMDGRFDREKDPVLKAAVEVFEPQS